MVLMTASHNLSAWYTLALATFGFISLGFWGALAKFSLGPIADLVGGIIKNKSQSKAQQQKYDQERQNWLLNEKPKAEAAAQRKLVMNNLRTSIAKSYGVDKLMPNFFNFSDRADAVVDPYAKTKRPGGFSWGGLAADAVRAGANAYTGYQADKTAQKRAEVGYGYGARTSSAPSLPADPRQDYTAAPDYGEYDERPA